jgi:acyl-CoA dehydrogenase
VSFETESTAGTPPYLRDPSIRLLVDFFQAKGLAALKEEDREERWYQDWIDYQAGHGLYASLLSPAKYSNRGNRFRLRRLTRFLEVIAYLAPAHGYSLHVSFLGLFPILLGDNEKLKKEAIAKLENGGLFAFGVSEKTHGSDLFANEMTVRPTASGLVAAGSKYYIGNANAACMVSILGKKGEADAASSTKRAPFVFFVVRPGQAPAYRNVAKIRTMGVRPAFVGEFDVEDHPLPEADIISQGRQAWDAVFATVNYGKYFLGFGAIGLCERAIAEAFAHVQGRIVYGKSVFAMPHIRALFADAFARLTAMKFFAWRALDYVQAAQPDERRHLLFAAVQKARVSTQGVRVIDLLSECVGAYGFESRTFFELAARDVRLIPGLEGSTHINFGLAAQFIGSYFGSTNAAVPVPESACLGDVEPDENPCWFAAPDRTAKTVRFAPFETAFQPWDTVPNMSLFTEQARTFAALAADGFSRLNPSVDAGLFIAAGKCFSIIVYAQLVAENCLAAKAMPALVSLIFHGLIEDLSAEALKLSAMFGNGSAERDLLGRMARVPEIAAKDLDEVIEFCARRYPTL